MSYSKSFKDFPMIDNDLWQNLQDSINDISLIVDIYD